MQFKGKFFLKKNKKLKKKQPTINIPTPSCQQIQENLYKMHGHLAVQLFNSSIGTKYIHALYLKQCNQDRGSRSMHVHTYT